MNLETQINPVLCCFRELAATGKPILDMYWRIYKNIFIQW